MTMLEIGVEPSCVAAKFGYLGWTGHSNLGDDAIAEVLRVAMPTADLKNVPTGIGELRAVTTGNARADLRRRRLFLGGGTVIGRANWRVHVAVGRWLCRGGPPILLGAGVEDPSFRGRRSFSSFGELRRWKPVLAEFDRVTVRGPRSAALLADVGVASTVVGDPALLVVPPVGVIREPGRVAVSLGYGDALRGGDHNRVVLAVAGLLRELRRTGRDISMLVVNPTDRPHTAACLAAAGIEADDVRWVDASQPVVFCHEVAACDLMVAERLHAGILGAACGVVPVMLAYQPKVDDFMASIHASDRCLSTDGITTAGVIQLVDDVSSDIDSERSALRERVTFLRKLLAREIANLTNDTG